MTFFLYVLTVLIWGTTWIAIKFQIGDVDLVVSVLYRFALAGVLMLVILLVLRKIQATTIKDHGWFAMQGACLFCFNFIAFYYASQYMPSGLVSIIFSTAIFFNAINNRLFWGVMSARSVYIAGVFGVVGLVLLFWPEIQGTQSSSQLLLGVGLGMLGTCSFSFGNMISVRNKNKRINTLTSNAYGMNYGALILLMIVLFSDASFSWDARPLYVYSLLYLAIPGSIIAFTSYLSLVGRVGPNQAAYATVMFPVIALAISWLYEGYTFSLVSALGLVSVLIGNAVAANIAPFKSARDQ